ncbi:MAG: SpoIIE family protein phosphatase [Acidimicrobiia bacterium]
MPDRVVRRWPMWAVATATLVTYVVGSEAAWHFFGANLGFAFFPPAGASLAAFMWSPRRSWPLVVMTIVVAESLVDVHHNKGFWIAAAYGGANAIEPLVGAMTIRFLARRRRLDMEDLGRRSATGAFIVGGMIVGPVVGSLFGSVIRQVEMPGSAVLVSIAHWSAGDALGVLVFGAPILLFGHGRWRWIIERRSEVAIMMAVTTLASVIVFGYIELPVMYLMLPLALAIGFWLDVRGVALASIAVATVADYATSNGRGPFAALSGSSLQVQLGMLKLFLGATVLAAWYFAIEVDERDRAQRAAREGEAEHDALMRLQRSVLTPATQGTRSLSLSVKYQPGKAPYDLGGDWYDAIELGDGTVTVMVGDVVGGGLPAAITMTQLRSAARGLAPRCGPAELLSQLDTYVHSVDGAFCATLACARFDPVSGTLVYSRAGHPPLMVRGADGLVRLSEDAVGPPLGVPGVRRDASIDIGVGETVLLYTDGLIERRGDFIDVGIERLEHAFSETPLTAGWLDTVVGRCLDETNQRDDIAALAFTFTGPPAHFDYTVEGPASLARSRARLRRWLVLHDIETQMIDDLALVVNEASTNAMFHSGTSTSPTVRLDLAADEIAATIADAGSWKENVVSSAEPGAGGHGLPLMRALTDSVAISTSEAGTVVELRKSRR